MARRPDGFLHLDSLKDHVNPVLAKGFVYAEQPGLVDLWVKDAKLSASDATGWSALPGTEKKVAAGQGWHDFKSKCLSKSGKLHVKSRLQIAGKPPVFSELHYVIVDAKKACP